MWILLFEKVVFIVQLQLRVEACIILAVSQEESPTPRKSIAANCLLLLLLLLLLVFLKKNYLLLLFFNKLFS